MTKSHKTAPLTQQHADATPYKRKPNRQAGDEAQLATHAFVLRPLRQRFANMDAGRIFSWRGVNSGFFRGRKKDVFQVGNSGKILVGNSGKNFGGQQW